MTRLLRRLIFVLLLSANLSQAEHVIVTGGPALRRWENLRTKVDQHDRFWGNFVRASTIRMAEIKQAYGTAEPIVWIVFQPGYQARGREDRSPYATWITQLATKYRTTLIWISSGGDLIQAINSRPRQSITTFDFFGHSNRYAFMLDYSSDIMAVSTAWLHERELGRIKASVFARNAYCKSWGCHTGESMSKAWKRALGIPLEGANGSTNYQTVSFGRLPSVSGTWVR
jgi:hypothetical protein